MSRGSIRRRGKRSWQIRFDDGVNAAGRRNARWATVKGTRQDAQKELTRLLAAADAGTLPEPSRATVTEYLHAWLDNDIDLSPKTKERYRELAENQIIPHIGKMVLQKLKPKQVGDWHKMLLKNGAKGGGALSARTVGHAHRVLHRALEIAVEDQVLARNVASIKSPPTVTEEEVEILTKEQIPVVIEKLAGHHLYDIVVVDLNTGLRRDELLALRLSDVDLDKAELQVSRSHRRFATQRRCGATRAAPQGARDAHGAGPREAQCGHAAVRGAGWLTDAAAPSNNPLARSLCEPGSSSREFSRPAAHSCFHAHPQRRQRGQDQPASGA